MHLFSHAGVIRLLSIGLPCCIAAARVHTRLLRSEPAKDTTVAAAPTEVRLWFSEAVTVSLTRATLESGATTVPLGKASRAGGAEAPVVLPVPTPLAPGPYVVRWSTASADGHPVKGTFRFTVGSAGR